MGAMNNRSVTKLQSGYWLEQERNEIGAKRRKKLLLRRLVVFVLFAGVMSYFMISTLISQASSLDEIKQEQKQLNAELTGLKKDEKILKEEIVKLNDDEYIGKLARKEYFLSEEGEFIFNIPTKEKKEKTTE